MNGEQRADVVVIGGGIVGCAAAYELAKRGAAVTLVEKGRIGGEQSSRAWGFVRQQGRDPDEVPLMIAANQLWQGLSAELGEDIEWVQGGNIGVANDEARMEQFRGWLDVARAHGLDTRILSRAELEELLPGLQGPAVGGMYTPSDGHAEPYKATEALARAARRHGATIITGSAVEGLEREGGRVTGVRTEGGRIDAPVVICAAGAHASAIARMAGLSLPLRVVRSTVAQTEPAPPVTRAGVWAPGIAFRQKPDGSFYIAAGRPSDYHITLDALRHLPLFLPNYLKNRSMFQFHLDGELVKDVARRLPGAKARTHPFAHTVGVEPEVNRQTVAATRRNLLALFPHLGNLRVRRAWAGMIDATPDAVPVIGPAEAAPGLVFATGFSGHGFAMGPIAGRLLAELVLDGKPSLDLHAMRFSRFAEGDLARPRNVL